MKLFLMNKKGSSLKGAVTPAVAVILFAVCLFNAAFTDFAVYRCAKYQISRRADMACSSIMASFDSLLADYYGIYGVNILHYTDYEADFRQFATFYKEKGRIQFWNWDLSDYEISLKGALSEPDALEEQINALMKYETAANALDYLIDYFTNIGDALNTGEAALILSEGNALLTEADGYITKLENVLCGVYKGDRACANGYKYVLSDCATIMSYIFDFDMDELEKTELCDMLYQEHINLKNILNTYLNYNSEGLTYVLSLQKTKQKIDSLIKKAENLTKSSEEDVSGLDEMITSLRKQSTLISNLYNYTKISDNIKGFQSKISGLISNISAIESFRQDSTDIPDLETMYSNVNSALYTNDIFTSFNVLQLVKSSELQGTYTDDRFLSFDIEGIYGEDTYKISDSIYKTLPSICKEISPDTTGFKIDFTDLSGLEDIMSAGSFLEGIKEAGQACLSKIFIEEYIYTYFTNRITAPDNAKFKCQMEYILCGNQSSSDNIKATSNKLLFLRFVLNFASILSSEEKVAMAKETGLMIAAAVSGAIGADLYAILIMAAWAMTDSISDVTTLVNGGKVPVIKTSETKDGSGLDYTSYLMILIMLMPSDTVLLRTADIIETDMTDKTGERYKLSGIYTEIKAKCTYKPEFFTAVFFVKGKEGISLEYTGNETM